MQNFKLVIPFMVSDGYSLLVFIQWGEWINIPTQYDALEIIQDTLGLIHSMFSTTNREEFIQFFEGKALGSW